MRLTPPLNDALRLVREGARPKEAAASTGEPLQRVYRALRAYQPLPRTSPANLEDVAGWIRARLIVEPAARVNSAEAYKDFNRYVAPRPCSATMLNRYLAHLGLPVVKSNGVRWVIGARMR